MTDPIRRPDLSDWNLKAIEDALAPFQEGLGRLATTAAAEALQHALAGQTMVFMGNKDPLRLTVSFDHLLDENNDNLTYEFNLREVVESACNKSGAVFRKNLIEALRTLANHVETAF